MSKFFTFMIVCAIVTCVASATCQDCANKGKSWYCPSNSKCFGDHPLCALDCKDPCQDTKSCNTCYEGYNCTCGQCAETGFSYYCPMANECYHSLTTCAISCGNDADCFPTSSCVPPSDCSASQAAVCNTTQTCCLDDKSNAFCAPYANATCCQVGQMTCPQGYVCYPPENKCLPPPPSPPPECTECQQIVSSIESGSCSKCSQLFPAFSWLCSLISMLGLCTWIEQKEMTPLNVCEMIGFCGDEGCTCGYCRPQLYGQWCLSLPNNCPAAGARPVKAPTFATERDRNEHYGRTIGRVVGRLEAHKRERGANRIGNFCVDSVCEEEHLGCCLTCV